MLAKINRLTDDGDFKRVQEKGSVFQSGNFGVALYERGDNLPTRFGFVVSTKVSHNASDRNYAKRKMSEGVRRLIPDVRNGLDVVFLSKPSIVRVSTENTMREVASSLKESGVLK